mmetsp:Transcript_124739/g.347360  ORF Transcript_124739/g.347360 Transcript_124739/m.347360 type:complete len:297 (-) Transcript_124739:910-1800(-)
MGTFPDAEILGAIDRWCGDSLDLEQCAHGLLPAHHTRSLLEWGAFPRPPSDDEVHSERHLHVLLLWSCGQGGGRGTSPGWLLVAAEEGRQSSHGHSGWDRRPCGGLCCPRAGAVCHRLVRRHDVQLRRRRRGRRSPPKAWRQPWGRWKPSRKRSLRALGAHTGLGRAHCDRHLACLDVCAPDIWARPSCYQLLALVGNCRRCHRHGHHCNLLLGPRSSSGANLVVASLGSDRAVIWPPQAPGPVLAGVCVCCWTGLLAGSAQSACAPSPCPCRRGALDAREPRHRSSWGRSRPRCM